MSRWGWWRGARRCPRQIAAALQLNAKPHLRRLGLHHHHPFCGLLKCAGDNLRVKKAIELVRTRYLHAAWCCGLARVESQSHCAPHGPQHQRRPRHSIVISPSLHPSPATTSPLSSNSIDRMRMMKPSSSPALLLRCRPRFVAVVIDARASASLPTSIFPYSPHQTPPTLQTPEGLLSPLHTLRIE
ncbi:unnamed protein product [Periconia digitata]|uniref:Uncharacterized protein n=1 Tax=Periconia digitata TaxID=1303443 RepID=A0A9W4XRG4_9PLEO|nr:unnamed protein product [Periconia digitata]